jgi:hypothetical protein
MKTKLITLLLILIAFSSCNTAKHYANYRFGGKSKQESKTLIEEIKTEEVSTQIQEEKSDTLLCPIQKDSASIKSFLSIAEKKTIIKTKKTVKSIEKKNYEKKRKILVKEKSGKKRCQMASNKKNIPLHQFAIKSSGFDTDDLLYTLGVIAIIAGGAFSLYILGVSLLEIVTFVVGMILVVILLSLLGKAIMSIFPGMSKKNKKRLPIKNIFGKIFPSYAMKYYGGMSVKSMFWIGTGLIAVGLLVTSIYTAPFWVFDILFSLFSIWLVGCLIIGAFVAIFEGITR